MNNTQIIYRLCNENNWFTGGDNQAYSKLFELAEIGVSIQILAHCIWLVSDSKYLEIYKAIKQSGYKEGRCK